MVFDPEAVIRQSRANVSHKPVTTAHYLIDIVMNEEEPELTSEQHCARLADEFQRALDAGFFESIRYDMLIFSVPQRLVLDVAPPNEPLTAEEKEWAEYEEPQEVCPKCESDNISNEDGPDDGRLPVTCLNCGHQWHEPAMREVEYYRCWAGNGGDSGSWDTDFIKIPLNTPDDQLTKAVQAAAAKIEWKDEAPCFVGYYAESESLGDDDDGEDG